MAQRDGLQKSATMTGVTDEQHFLLLSEKRGPTSPAQISMVLLLSEGITQPGIIYVSGRGGAGGRSQTEEL